MRHHRYDGHVLQGQDIVVLLDLARQRPNSTVRGMAGGLELPHAGVHRSLQRLKSAGLYESSRKRVNVARAEEFLVHAVKYMFPASFKGEGRGIPTAWAADPLRQELAPPTGLPPVWPDPRGKERGLVLEPLHASVPKIASRDPELGGSIALVDAIRAGDARIAGLAAKKLSRWLRDAGKGV
jgi:hypothetical protein